MPPIEDLLEDQEEQKGAPVSDTTRTPATVRAFMLAPLLPPEPKKKNRTTDKSKKVSKAERFRGYAAAFQAGYSRGVGQAVAVEGIRSGDHVFVRCCNTHAKGDDGAGLQGEAFIAWIETKAEAFGRAVGNVSYPYHKFNDWMNGVASKTQREMGAQPAGKNTATSWKSGPKTTEEEKRRIQEAAKGIDL